MRCEVKVCIAAVWYCSTGWKCVIINVVLPVCCVTSDKSYRYDCMHPAGDVPDIVPGQPPPAPVHGGGMSPAVRTSGTLNQSLSRRPEIRLDTHHPLCPSGCQTWKSLNELLTGSLPPVMAQTPSMSSSTPSGNFSSARPPPAPRGPAQSGRGGNTGSCLRDGRDWPGGSDRPTNATTAARLKIVPAPSGRKVTS